MLNILDWSIDTLSKRSIRIGAGGLIIAGLLGLIHPASFFHAYLAAFLCWTGIGFGAMAFLLLHHSSGGRWPVTIRPILEAGTSTTFLAVLLFLPILVGMGWLYSWYGNDAHWHHPFLSGGWFVIRAIIYFAIWCAGAFLLDLRSCRNVGIDKARRDVPLGTAGLLIFFVTMSLAAIDWIGTLQEHWYSSIIGLYVIIGQAISALAVCVMIVNCNVRDAEPRGECPVSADLRQDLGTLLLACVVLHAYFGFSQFLIIWNGNLPHEITWYAARSKGLWGAVSILIIVVHFFLPFALLLSRDIKRNTTAMIRICGTILIMRVIESIWMVIPSMDHKHGTLWLTVPLAMAGVGGIWTTAFLWYWTKGPMLAPEPPKEEHHETNTDALHA
jgi:hypothetical protein